MIHSIIFDVDGVILHKNARFSERIARDFGVAPEKITSFFVNEFQSCLIGRSDLLHELKKYVHDWGWQDSIEKLILYWFEGEAHKDEKMIQAVLDLKHKGTQCYLGTNNEKYRVEYLLETAGLKNIVDGVFVSYQVGYKKSQPEFWQYVHTALSPIKKDEILLIDDEEENIRAAKNFGFRAELYTDFHSFEKNLKTLA